MQYEKRLLYHSVPVCFRAPVSAMAVFLRQRRTDLSLAVRLSGALRNHRICLRQFRSVKQIHKNGIQTKAVVKDYTVRYEKIKTYYPVIQFQTAAGITCKYESTSGMSFISPKYRKGKTIPIAYIDSNPGQFIIIPADYYVSAMGLVMFAFIWIPCAIGAVFLLLNNTA